MNCVSAPNKTAENALKFFSIKMINKVVSGF